MSDHIETAGMRLSADARNAIYADWEATFGPDLEGPLYAELDGVVSTAPFDSERAADLCGKIMQFAHGYGYACMDSLLNRIGDIDRHDLSFEEAALKNSVTCAFEADYYFYLANQCCDMLGGAAATAEAASFINGGVVDPSDPAVGTALGSALTTAYEKGCAQKLQQHGAGRVGSLCP